MKRIIYEPSATIQVLLGSNGSGKTSLLNLLFGLPCDPNDLLEGGYIKASIGMNGNIYTLKAERSADKVHYSFIENDQTELNTSNKVTSQRKLVDEYFKINSEVLELMTSNSSLTKMSKNKRKEWMIRSAKTDFTYILTVYDKVKKKLSYHKHVLAHTSQKLDAQLAIPEEVTEAELEHLAKLKYTLEHLLLQKEDCGNTDYSVDKYEHMLHTLNNLVKTHLTLKRELYLRARPLVNSRVIGEMDLNNKVQHSLTRLSTLSDSLDEVYETISNREQVSLNLSELPPREAILADLSTLEFHEKSLEGTPNDVYNMEAVSTHIRNTLGDFCKVELTLEELQALRTRDGLLAEELKRVVDSISETTYDVNELAHLKEHAGAECPECSTFFYRAEYSPEEHARLTERLNTLIERKEEILKTLKSNSDIITTNYSGYEYLKDLTDRTLVPRYKAMVVPSPEFDLVTLNNQLINDIILVKNHLSNVSQQTEKDRLHSLLKLRDRLEDDIASVEREVTSELDFKASKLLSEKSGQQRLLTELKDLEKGFEELSTLTNDMFRLRDTVANYRDEAIKKEKQDIIHNKIMFLKSEIADIEELVFRSKERSNNIASMEVELAELNDEYLTLKEVEASLCPKRGLIAVGVRSYMEAFVSIMNTHIKQIWETDLCLTVPDITKMDYSFPVQVENSPVINKDVAQTSAGQREVIDLAYKLTMLQMLGYKGYPLILDEFGVWLDKAHRDKAYKYIITLSQTGRYNKIFMVSHYADLYSSLSADTEYSVLDDKNIEVSGLPNAINKCLLRSAH